MAGFYPWYEVVSGQELEQGDIVSGCLKPEVPIVDATTDSTEPLDQVTSCEVIVLSQTCDLANDKARSVMLCPVVDLELWLNEVTTKKSERAERIGQLEKGRLVAYQLLDLCNLPDCARGHMVVSFSDAFSVDLGYFKNLAGSALRLRLLPPYREHLAQAFARYYMRVALPLLISPIPASRS